MAKNQPTKRFKRIGSERTDYYIAEPQPQPKKKFDWDGLFGVIFIVFCVLALVGSCSA